jgi:hypothetical protein
MPAILRIDVDHAYENRILHYVRLDQELFLALDSLWYLKHCKEMVNDLKRRRFCEMCKSKGLSLLKKKRIGIEEK